MNETALIASEAAVAALCAQAKVLGWVAIDTEFIRDRSYFPKLCLIQLAVPGVGVCIDPLSSMDLTPVQRLCADNEITKVFHAAEQDLELFFLRWGFVPAPVFDTQVAAPLLGYRDQIGYAALVEDLLGIELSKGQTRTDWAERPLSVEQLQYAVDDVNYLAQLYPMIYERLEANQRLAWLDEDFQRLRDSSRYQTGKHNAWRRVKSAGRLKGLRLLALQKLAEWRELKAIELDKPRRWVLTDDVLLGIAQSLPEDRHTLARVRGLSDGFLLRNGQAMLDLIAAARKVPRSDWPVSNRRVQRLTSNEEAMADIMYGLLRLLAAEQSISPAALANRRDLEALLTGAPTPLLSGWRFALAGQCLKAWLDGQISLRVGHSGELRRESYDRSQAVIDE